MAEQRTRSDTVPEEFDGLIAEFRGLLQKYPDAVQHFSLAYHPAGHGQDPDTPTTVSFTQPVFECSEIEPGFVVCERVDEQ
ncbi:MULTISPECIES: hypothetical protein [Streptomyces]|uniref:Uncharacterized protein n=1 Tax=Streptomyces solicathayae TaxID=3081768 RepID=A0ABZ0M3M6_9ACTN|nr:hypothetical protein [Streptomyces sp. HUAS YS2]WOX26395.1 hypothetical protein R2D22_35490 [Streptomyces sp. HUAS YS2]